MKFVPALLFLLATSVAGYAQLSPEKALQILDEKYPQEKIHLFLNKEVFVAGEQVHFKAYLFSGYVTSLISSTMYVELFNDQQSIKSRISIPLFNGIGQGTFTVDEGLEEGIYHIRAYTKWMVNFDPGFFYISSIRVYNLQSKKEMVGAPTRWTAMVFPESGSLIADIQNKASVRLFSNGSLPLTWKGILVNKTDPDKAILTFNSLTPDVGSFYFYPEPGNVYEVHIKDDAGNEARLPLIPKTEGIVLQAEQSGSELYVDMIFKGIKGGGRNYKLVAQMQQELVYSSVIRKEQEAVKTSIPVSKMINGILHLTLFDPQNEPVAERLVFIENDPFAPENIRHSTKITDKKQIEILIGADSADHYTYSLAVEDASFYDERLKHIYGDLYFSDLSVKIADHRYYFTGQKVDALSRDALMITERWTRFSWSKVLKNDFPQINHKAEKFLSYRGTVTRNKKAVANQPMTLMLRFPDSSLQFLQVTTNEFGEFHLDDVIFYDTVKVFYQGVEGKRRTDLEVSFEKKAFQSPPVSIQRSNHVFFDRAPQDSLPPVLMKVLDKLNGEKAVDPKYSELEGVEVSAGRKTEKQKLNEELASPLFQTQQEQVFDIMHDEPSIQSYANILDWLDGRVAGLGFRILNEGDTYINPLTMQPDSAPAGGTRVPMMRDQQVSLFIDESPTDLDGILSLPTSDIALVKVIKGYFLGANGGGAGGGAIAVYTRKAGLEKNEKPSLPSATIVGYSPINLNQGTENSIDSWSPLLPFANSKIRTEISVDPKIPYRITLTGVNKDQKPIFYSFEVK